MAYWFLDGGGGWRFMLPYIKEGDTITGSNPQINQFFREFTNCNVIDLHTKPSLYTGKIRSVIPNILRSYDEYRKHFKGIKNDQINLFGGLTTITFFSYIKKLSKHNDITYYMTDLKVIDQKQYHGIYRIPMKILGYIMGLNIGITKQHGRPNWCMTKDTIKKFSHVAYDHSEPDIELPEKYKSMVEGKEILLLLGDVSELQAYDSLGVCNDIASVLDKSKTILKEHTRCYGVFGDLNDFDTLPAYIPAELLMGAHNWKYIISLHMCKALQYKTKAENISLLQLFRWKKPIKGGLVEIAKTVTQPKTIEELQSIIKGDMNTTDTPVEESSIIA